MVGWSGFSQGNMQAVEAALSPQSRGGFRENAEKYQKRIPVRIAGAGVGEPIGKP